jgi:ABC-type transport system involved in cytochrome c biogenesis permease component
LRWLFLKDLRILRRSPFLVALLIVYPALVALLIGLALSRGPDKPRVAFVNEVPVGQSTIDLGGKQVDLSRYSSQFFRAVDPVRVDTREQAVDKVRSGDALAALVIPADIVDKLASGIEQARVEVIFNGDALKQSFVQSTIDAKLAEANGALADRLRDVALQDVRLLIDGGRLNTPLGNFDLLGLSNTERILRAVVASLPRADSRRAALQRVASFSKLAHDGLGFARSGLVTVSRPVAVQRTVVDGRKTPLDTFAVAIAVTVSLMFVCVLLAAGMLALEREEQAFGRLVRGLVSPTALLGEKVGLAAACGAVVALVMLCGIGAFVGLAWGRFALWLAALAVAGVAFGALGVAVGALAREVRAASLLAIMLTLPLAFLALVPSGAVAGGLYDVIRVVSALFPFKPALQALDAAVNGARPALPGPLVHLAGLALAFGALARVALRRFAT